MRSRLGFLVLLLLVSAPLLAVQVPFSEPRRTGPAAYDQAAPVAASNGIDYMTAWTTVAFSPQQTLHVYGTIVRGDGSVEGEIARPLDDDQFAYGVSLSQGRDGYFAAWMSEKGMTAAVIDSYGRVERRTTVEQSDPYHSGHTITAWNGAVHIVISGFATGYSATLLDDNGGIIAANVPIGDTHGDASSVDVIADSGGFLVLATKRFYGDPFHDEIYGRRVSPTGATGEWFLVRSVASAVTSLTAIADGARDVIVWGDQFGTWTMDFYPANLLAGSTNQISPDTGATVTRMIKANGRFWLAWATWQNEEFVTPIDTDLRPATSIALGTGYRPQIATNGTSILAVRSTHDGPIFVNDVVGRFISPAGGDFLVSKSRTDQSNGELASNGTITLAVWDEEIGSGREIFAARFDGNGHSLDGAGVQISSGGMSVRPSAAFNGRDWLIAWTRNSLSGSTIAVARRFSANGILIDGEDIVLGKASSSTPRVSSDGSSWAVAWIAVRPWNSCSAVGSTSRAVVGRVSGDGVALDPDGVAVDPAGLMEQSGPDIGWNGSKYVVAWRNYCTLWHQPARQSFAAALVSPDLERVDLVPLSGVATATSFSNPVVAADAGGAIVAWDMAGKTFYQLVDDSSAPRRARARAVGTPRTFSTVDGSLVGVARAATGQWMVFTKKQIPWAAGYQGVFYSIPGPDGVEIGSGLGTILDGNELLMNHVVRSGRYAWITQALFDADAGAQRLWMRSVDQ